MKRYRLLVALAALMLVIAACTSDEGDTDTTEGATDTTAAATDTTEAMTDTTEAMTDTTEATGGGGDGAVLEDVMARGEVNCGTRDALPGFAVLTEEGEHVGFDSDFCRVIAAAVLGDAEAVNHVDLETADRFTALQSGQIDVLVRNTTWTASRDGSEGATFLTTTYYDGQGMMVASDSGFESIEDMDGVIVCVAKGTTTEGNAATEATRLGLDWEVRPFDDTDLIQEAFLAGQCDGWSSDTSQLVGLRSVYPDGPDALTILPEVFSKEPLGPAVRDGDTAWAQAVDWAVLATIQAEEWGITSANVDDFLTSDNPNIVKFLGGEFDDGEGNVTVLDPGLGLPTDFAYQVISQVGNYGEIFEANLAPLGLQRGVNALWNDGGLMYSPPYR
ncbi:MAG: amino acid ABC transporter substrate-binding protein [Acidimicrobiia bacterium]|jgi:general L-amino acid transport system substrate-binding protein